MRDKYWVRATVLKTICYCQSLKRQNLGNTDFRKKYSERCLQIGLYSDTGRWNIIFALE